MLEPVVELRVAIHICAQYWQERQRVGFRADSWPRHASISYVPAMNRYSLRVMAMGSLGHLDHERCVERPIQAREQGGGADRSKGAAHKKGTERKAVTTTLPVE